MLFSLKTLQYCLYRYHTQCFTISRHSTHSNNYTLLFGSLFAHGAEFPETFQQRCLLFSHLFPSGSQSLDGPTRTSCSHFLTARSAFHIPKLQHMGQWKTIYFYHGLLRLSCFSKHLVCHQFVSNLVKFLLFQNSTLMTMAKPTNFGYTTIFSSHDKFLP